ncbi:hypothetical protein B0T16DRAFT_519044 [Cercophora newfieldiana]|uniref:Protein kinase domain-containing protein n=1 Tax=Cercophora newfieldiana TaxID=92897 RepID=A0AA39XTC6_9PEZI|nr:hypothetical protein B0T16DRAFT_519044 [Cercophora newfieldiana]
MSVDPVTRQMGNNAQFAPSYTAPDTPRVDDVESRSPSPCPSLNSSATTIDSPSDGEDNTANLNPVLAPRIPAIAGTKSGTDIHREMTHMASGTQSAPAANGPAPKRDDSQRSLQSADRGACKPAAQPQNDDSNRKNGRGNGDDGQRAESPQTRTVNQVPLRVKEALLACPYRKRNPAQFNVREYNACSLEGFDSITSLREHLKTSHDEQLARCARCGSDNASNQNECGCTFNVEDHLSVRTMNDIIRRYGASQETEQTWVAIYRGLFGEEEFVPDADWDAPIEMEEVVVEIRQNIGLLRARVKDEAERLVPQPIDAQNEVFANLTRVFVLFLEQILSSCQQRVRGNSSISLFKPLWPRVGSPTALDHSENTPHDLLGLGDWTKMLYYNLQHGPQLVHGVFSGPSSLILSLKKARGGREVYYKVTCTEQQLWAILKCDADDKMEHGPICLEVDEAPPNTPGSFKLSTDSGLPGSRYSPALSSGSLFTRTVSPSRDEYEEDSGSCIFDDEDGLIDEVISRICDTAMEALGLPPRRWEEQDLGDKGLVLVAAEREGEWKGVVLPALNERQPRMVTRITPLACYIVARTESATPDGSASQAPHSRIARRLAGSAWIMSSDTSERSIKGLTLSHTYAEDAERDSPPKEKSRSIPNSLFPVKFQRQSPPPKMIRKTASASRLRSAWVPGRKEPRFPAGQSFTDCFSPMMILFPRPVAFEPPDETCPTNHTDAIRKRLKDAEPALKQRLDTLVPKQLIAAIAEAVRNHQDKVFASYELFLQGEAGAKRPFPATQLQANARTGCLKISAPEKRRRLNAGPPQTPQPLQPPLGPQTSTLGQDSWNFVPNMAATPHMQPQTSPIGAYSPRQALGQSMMASVTASDVDYFPALGGDHHYVSPGPSALWLQGQTTPASFVSQDDSNATLSGASMEGYSVAGLDGMDGYEVVNRTMDPRHLTQVDLTSQESMSGFEEVRPSIPKAEFVRVFAILLLIDKSSSFLDFVNQDLSDDWLPLERLPSIGGSKQIQSARKPGSRSDEKIHWGVRHGDIKPSNILCFGSGTSCTLKLADFGLSCLTTPRATGDEQMDRKPTRYTPAYRAPEFALPDAPIGLKSDIWSLGCVVLEATTWYLLGSPELGRLARLRADGAEERAPTGDAFFELAGEFDNNLARLKPGICDWIHLLQNHPLFELRLAMCYAS